MSDEPKNLWGISGEIRASDRAIDRLFVAYFDLQCQGWQAAMYAPRDGSPIEVIECGSTGIHKGWRDEEGRFWVVSEHDTWPSTPVLFRNPTRSEDTSPGMRETPETKDG